MLAGLIWFGVAASAPAVHAAGRGDKPGAAAKFAANKAPSAPRDAVRIHLPTQFELQLIAHCAADENQARRQRTTRGPLQKEPAGNRGE